MGKGRLTTLEAEVAGLESRIGVLQTQVGTSPLAGGATAGAEVAGLVESKSFYEDYAKFIRSKGADLEATLSTLETKMHTVESNIQTLENQVKGNLFSAPSLLEVEAAKEVNRHEGVSIETRTAALEKAVSLARTRVTTLEQTVVG